MPDLVFEESSSTWMFLSLEKDLLEKDYTWIANTLVPKLLAGNYSDGAFPGTTTDHHKQTPSTLPHNNIISQTSEHLKVSPSTYQLCSSRCAVPLLSHPLLADQTPLLIVFRIQIHFPLPAHCKIKPLVKLHGSPDCFLD
ncbi:hypothetical protein AMECASPLE_016487, partial [Ameca splendens]